MPFRKFLGSVKPILRLRRLDVSIPSTGRGVPMSSRPPLVPLAVLCVASASLFLAACGGSSSSPTSSAAKEQQAEVKFADFARCLREHGIEAETATGPGGENHGLKIKGAGGPAKMEAAQKACKKYQPEPQKLNLSPQEKVERAEAVEKFAKCMREHGIEIHASSSEGRVAIRIGGKPGAGPNPESPAFQKAQSACQGLLPFKGKDGKLPPIPKRAPGGGQSGGSLSSESSASTGG
jgi:hypothetical protein